MSKTMQSGIDEWRHISDPPDQSGIYAVRERGTGAIRFAAYLARTESWCTPQRDIRLFDATPPAQSACGMHDFDGWRELDGDELGRLSPTAQAWAAGFLPPGSAILDLGSAGADPSAVSG